MYRKKYYDVDWESLVKQGDDPKYEVGDRVTIKGSEIENTGIISEVFGRNLFGQYEYYVEIRNDGRYCYEDELEEFKGEL